MEGGCTIVGSKGYKAVALNRGCFCPPVGALGNGWRHSAYQSQLQGPLAFSEQGDAANVLMHKTKSSPSTNFKSAEADTLF